MKAQLNTESCRVNVAIFEPRISIIQEVVAKYYGLTVDETKTHNRKKEIIKARQMVHYFSIMLLRGQNKNHECPLNVIGLLTGNGEAFDHATIIHGHKIVLRELTLKNRDRVLVYPDVLAEVTVLRDEIMKRFEDARAEPSVKRCSLCGQIII